MEILPLPPAPDRLVHARGVPAFGIYQGVIADLSWRALQGGPLQRAARKLHHKRWSYAAIAHDEVFVGLAVVDVGWTGTAFAYLFDRRERRVLAAASANGVPGLSTRVEDRAFGDARFRGGRLQLSFQRQDGTVRILLRAPGLTLDASVTLEPEVPVLASIAPANWLAHSTHKSGGLTVHGAASAAGRHYALDHAVASLDSSNGLLARETSWRWASAHARGLGFNLQQGYMADAENAIWLDGQLFRVGPARFDYDAAKPLDPWRIRTDDGLVRLRFTPEGARREDKNLIIAASRYVQPIGVFDGTLTHPQTGVEHEVRRLVGVTEDHSSRW